MIIDWHNFIYADYQQSYKSMIITFMSITITYLTDHYFARWRDIVTMEEYKTRYTQQKWEDAGLVRAPHVFSVFLAHLRLEVSVIDIRSNYLCLRECLCFLLSLFRLSQMWIFCDTIICVFDFLSPTIPILWLTGLIVNTFHPVGLQISWHILWQYNA